MSLSEAQNNREAEFVTEFDHIPEFWNFLLSLNRGDLIAELVQNDFDQNATKTVITFEKNKLICIGNGIPVDTDGWRRLRTIRGAGDKVPAKKGKIGVKNHGLKTGFTLGDEISVFSDGQLIKQTLYSKGWDNYPYPGASAKPRKEAKSPKNGCKIQIKYRTKPLEPREGEGFKIEAISNSEIDDLFKSACQNLPNQFVGLVSPGIVEEYKITLKHWKHGEVHYHFSCTRPNKVGKKMEFFRRKCEIKGTVDNLPGSLKEEAVRRFFPLKGKLKQRCPDFYRKDNKYFVEVSWPINQRGKPLKSTGRFRYPIGYPTSSLGSKTGHGIHFNSPFISDTERHGPAHNEEANKNLRDQCEALFLDIFTKRIKPKWGAKALNLLIPYPGSESKDTDVIPLLDELVKRDAIPKVSWKEAIGLNFKGKKKKALLSLNKLDWRKKSLKSQKYNFLIPIVTWGRGKIHTSLSVICPHQEFQIDPRIDSEIIALLANGKTEEFTEAYITFNEIDVLCRARKDDCEYFPISKTFEREFEEPLIALSYLDIFKEVKDKKQFGEGEEEDLQSNLLLPDNQQNTVSFKDLHISAPLPLGIPGLELPPLLHPDVASHTLFRHKSWRRPKYTLKKFLESETLQEVDEKTRKKFWKWLQKNEKEIGIQEQSKLSDISIWPNTKMQLFKLEELCLPRSKKVSTALGDIIHKPHKQVRRSKLTFIGGTRQTSIRQTPSEDELNAWFEKRRSNFEIEKNSGLKDKEAFERFEADLVALLQDTAIARILHSMELEIPGISKGGNIQLRRELLFPKKAHEQLALPSRFLLKKSKRIDVIDRLSPALQEPTAEMLMSAFVDDNLNFKALHARIEKLLQLTEEGDSHRKQLAEMPIIPVKGEPMKPTSLVFKGFRGDYWGNWKQKISAKGLSQDDQKRYINIGVTPADPKPDSSRKFFEWLSQQKLEIIKHHMICVMRHMLHHNGPLDWAKTFSDIPCIPTENQSELRLVSFKYVNNRRVFLRDLKKETIDQILKKDSGVYIAIDKVEGVKDPATENLRKLGVRSLREELAEPVQVEGFENVEDESNNLQEGLDLLLSNKFRNTINKRIVDLGINSDSLRYDWYDRVSKIKAIKSAKKIQAKYHYHSNDYHIEVRAGFDPYSGVFWVNADQHNIYGTFYKAVAEQLVFKSTVRPIELFALEHAIQMELNEHSFGRPAQSSINMDDDYDDNFETDNDYEQSEVGQATIGHSPFKPDPSRNKPKPSPLSETTKSRIGKRRTNNRSKSNSDGKSTFNRPLEKNHIESLKSEHYASHCQMCLCEHTPEKLAPVGSYVEWEEVRRRVIEAHHVDPKSGGGARHAGNIIILCKFHHDNFGRRLTQNLLTKALKKENYTKIIKFNDDDSESMPLQGRVVDVVIPDTGEKRSIFFSKEHVEYWLEH